MRALDADDLALIVIIQECALIPVEPSNAQPLPTTAKTDVRLLGQPCRSADVTHRSSDKLSAQFQMDTIEAVGRLFQRPRN
jgi:hypothetical protein